MNILTSPFTSMISPVVPSRFPQPFAEVTACIVAILDHFVLQCEEKAERGASPAGYHNHSGLKRDGKGLDINDG